MFGGQCSDGNYWLLLLCHHTVHFCCQEVITIPIVWNFHDKIHKCEHLPIFLACIVGYGQPIIIMTTDVVQKCESFSFHWGFKGKREPPAIQTSHHSDIDFQLSEWGYGLRLGLGVWFVDSVKCRNGSMSEWQHVTFLGVVMCLRNGNC